MHWGRFGDAILDFAAVVDWKPFQSCCLLIHVSEVRFNFDPFLAHFWFSLVFLILLNEVYPHEGNG